MLISQEELWDSLDRIIFPWEPRAITCQECGYVFPEALKQAAVVMVRDSVDVSTYKDNIAVMTRFKDEENVVDALRELRDNGFLNFIDTKDTQ